MHECIDKHCVQFFLSFTKDDEVHIIMEYMVSSQHKLESLAKCVTGCVHRKPRCSLSFILFCSVDRLYDHVCLPPPPPHTHTPRTRTRTTQNGGCLDSMMRRYGRLKEDELGYFMNCSLRGMDYLATVRAVGATRCTEPSGPSRSS